jgi:hypothetical protein
MLACSTINTFAAILSEPRLYQMKRIYQIFKVSVHILFQPPLNPLKGTYN